MECNSSDKENESNSVESSSQNLSSVERDYSRVSMVSRKPQYELYDAGIAFNKKLPKLKPLLNEPIPDDLLSLDSEDIFATSSSYMTLDDPLPKLISDSGKEQSPDRSGCVSHSSTDFEQLNNPFDQDPNSVTDSQDQPLKIALHESSILHRKEKGKLPKPKRPRISKLSSPGAPYVPIKPRLKSLNKRFANSNHQILSESDSANQWTTLMNAVSSSELEDTNDQTIDQPYEALDLSIRSVSATNKCKIPKFHFDDKIDDQDDLRIDKISTCIIQGPDDTNPPPQESNSIRVSKRKKQEDRAIDLNDLKSPKTQQFVGCMLKFASHFLMQTARKLEQIETFKPSSEKLEKIDEETQTEDQLESSESTINLCNGDSLMDMDTL